MHCVSFIRNSQKMAASPPFLLAPAPHATRSVPFLNLILGYQSYLMKLCCCFAAIGVLHWVEDGSLFGGFMAFDFKGHETKCQQWPIGYMGFGIRSPDLCVPDLECCYFSAFPYSAATRSAACSQCRAWSARCAECWVF